jgi:predicted secreted protein
VARRVPVEGPTMALEGATLPVEAPTLALGGATLPVEGPTMALEGATLPVEGPTLAVEVATLPVKGPTMTLEGATLPVKGPTMPLEGATLPVEGATMPLEGATLPVKGAAMALEGATVPVKGAATALEGATSPVEAPRAAFDARGAVRCPVRAGPRGAHRRRSLLQACDDFRHAKSQFELKPYVFALLARQVAPHLDTHILGLQNAQEPGHRRAYGVRPVTCLAQRRSQKGFDVHVASRSIEVLHCVPTGTCAA